eukprot:TRINITY_DN1350_c0_g1_i3.p1 TRINITY_DN1350_c0_g1~~TRINITY_DN1350_c0_g1_i3.p1  ORF type:complete len:152 (-),score=58.03 TRINITY_DN1350_c0_g1_i3:211-666(-)
MMVTTFDQLNVRDESLTPFTFSLSTQICENANKTSAFKLAELKVDFVISTPFGTNIETDDDVLGFTTSRKPLVILLRFRKDEVVMAMEERRRKKKQEEEDRLKAVALQMEEIELGNGTVEKSVVHVEQEERIDDDDDDEVVGPPPGFHDYA